MTLPRHLVQTSLLVSAIGLPFAALGQTSALEGVRIVATHTVTFTQPASRVPTNYMVDGPLLGNGDVGVVQSGPPEALRFWIGKNDFWTITNQSPMPVGQVVLLAPGLTGASYQVEEDMLLAETRGTFKKEDSELATRSFVDANHNLLCTTLTNTGHQPLALEVRNMKGSNQALATPPAQVAAPSKPPLLGCEQHGGGRWYFKGAMADVHLVNRALTAPEVTTASKASRGKEQPFDGKTSYPVTAPAIDKALTFSAWINPASLDSEANYLLSTGDWNNAYSVGLSDGHLRFTLNGLMLQCEDRIATARWTHVDAVYDGRVMKVYLDGQLKKSLGENADDGDAYLYDPDARPNGRKVGVSTRVLGGNGSPAFTLKPGESATVATVILSDLDTNGKDPFVEAKAGTGPLTRDSIIRLTSAHREWWHAFWSRSFIEMPDKVIEQHWYSSQYIMASCSRAGKIAPGLWGNWITHPAPQWHGDYHLNYNFQAPFFGVYAANHADVSLPFYDAMNAMIPLGQTISKAHGWKGIHLPVSMGPWGMCPEGVNSDWGQRSNTVYAALLYIWYWQYTHDDAWLKKDGYHFVREVAAFWEDYLKFENGRYVIYNDSIHEGSGADFNPIMSLGMVRTLFSQIGPMSEAANLDADKRSKWKDIHDKLSDYPTQEKSGKTVFRYSEKGTPWWGDNTLGIQHIFPGGGLGLDSDPKLLEISHNMIDAMARWRDNNGASSWYVACVRVGYDPVKILAELRNMYDHHSMPNKLLNFGGGGIENVSPSLAITEMMLQSHDGVLRIFPCWPKNQDARFGSLRAVGAFLVDAEIKGGEIGGVKIFSEKGLDCTIVNPWQGKQVQVTRNNKSAEVVRSERFILKTKAGETIGLIGR